MYNNAFLECDAQLPDRQRSWSARVTPTSITGMNDIDWRGVLRPGAQLQGGATWARPYFVIENLLNEDPAKVAGGRGAGFYQGQSNVTLYDRFGTHVPRRRALPVLNASKKRERGGPNAGPPPLGGCHDENSE